MKERLCVLLAVGVPTVGVMFVTREFIIRDPSRLVADMFFLIGMFIALVVPSYILKRRSNRRSPPGQG